MDAVKIEVIRTRAYCWRYMVCDFARHSLAGYGGGELHGNSQSHHQNRPQARCFGKYSRAIETRLENRETGLSPMMRNVLYPAILVMAAMVVRPAQLTSRVIGKLYDITERNLLEVFSQN